MGSYVNSTSNFDNILLQSLMGRLQIRQPILHAPLSTPPFLTPQSLEDLFFSDNLLDFSDSDIDGENEFSSSSKTQLSKEESKLEKEIIRIILSGKSETLKPNSGQAVMIGEHHICVGFQEDTGSDYRAWEWHGHIMLLDEEHGYTPEYIYGNYFERVSAAKRQMKEEKKESDDNDVNGKEKDEEKVGNVGLRGLIESAVSGTGRILHRNLNANAGLSRKEECLVNYTKKNA